MTEEGAAAATEPPTGGRGGTDPRSPTNAPADAAPELLGDAVEFVAAPDDATEAEP
ncbi:hypothetical protein [Halobaculum sp. EA56]|uniref:hypothetical protein n=1 Tax=Halobaculum sp. EA56 TaxID=3421648 RepID=UPI003EC0E0C4